MAVCLLRKVQRAADAIAELLLLIRPYEVSIRQSALVSSAMNCAATTIKTFTAGSIRAAAGERRLQGSLLLVGEARSFALAKTIPALPGQSPAPYGKQFVAVPIMR